MSSAPTYPVVRAAVLSAHHLVDPDRRVRRRAARRRGVVLEHPEPLADADRAFPVRRMFDPDLREAVVHRPLEALRRAGHLRLDHVEQTGQVQPVRVPRHPLGGQRPAGARHHRIGIGRPGQAQRLRVRALLHHVADEPVVHLRRTRLAQHRVQLVPPVRLRPADQQRQQPRRAVAGRPQLPREVLLRLQPLRYRPQLAQVDPVVVAVPLVDRADLRVVERGQLGRHLGQRRRLRHQALPPYPCPAAYGRARRSRCSAAPPVSVVPSHRVPPIPATRAVSGTSGAAETRRGGRRRREQS